MNEFTAGEKEGRRFLFSLIKDAPVFLLAEHNLSSEYLESLYGRAARRDFGIFAYETKDWDGDLSPWPAEAGGGRAFSGGADRTLDWLVSMALPLSREASRGPVYLTGYSLAGLFSLYGLYRSDAFDGAVCCSSSLWFPGWTEFASSHHPYPEKEIYLSLGGKEAMTSDPVMCTIETKTKTQEKLLRQDPCVKRSVLRMVPGGHFADSARRLAEGIDWILTDPHQKRKEER